MGDSAYRVMFACLSCGNEFPKITYRRFSAAGNPYYLKRCEVCTWSANSAPEATVQQRKRLEISLRHKYQMTPEENELLHAAQGGICAIEGCDRPATRIDHDHKTGRVRGRLCHKCNIGLHYLEDDDWLKQATAYLARKDAMQ